MTCSPPETRRALVQEENRAYVDHLTRLVEERRGEIEIVDPWDDRFSPTARAAHHCRLIEWTYDGGHPISRFRLDTEIAQQVARGEFLCWLALWRGQPVGTSAIRIGADGLAYVVQSGELTAGTELQSGVIYDGQLRISSLMYRRFADFMSVSESVANVFALQGDVMMRAPRTMPDGRQLQGASRTQHINATCELRPFLLCAPWFVVHSQQTGRMDFGMVSRRYLLRLEADQPAILYTPDRDSEGRVTCAAIARVTFALAFGVSPSIVDDTTETALRDCRLVLPDHSDTAELHLSGTVTRTEIARCIADGLEARPTIRIIVPNYPGNVVVQRTLLEMGLKALGCLPGARPGIETMKPVVAQFHYATLRPDIRADMSSIELARDYDSTPIPGLVDRLMNEWKNA